MLCVGVLQHRNEGQQCLALLQVKGNWKAAYLLLVRFWNMAEKFTCLPEQDILFTELLLQKLLRSQKNNTPFNHATSRETLGQLRSSLGKH